MTRHFIDQTQIDTYSDAARERAMARFDGAANSIAFYAAMMREMQENGWDAHLLAEIVVGKRKRRNRQEERIVADLYKTELLKAADKAPADQARMIARRAA